MVICPYGKLKRRIPGTVSYPCNTLAEVKRLMEQYVASFLCGLYLRWQFEFFSDSCRTKMAACISIVFPIDHLTWRGRCTAWTCSVQPTAER